MKAMCYLLLKFPKLTGLTSTKLGPWEAGSIIRNIFKVLYHQGNINIVSYYENCIGAKPLTSIYGLTQLHNVNLLHIKFCR